MAISLEAEKDFGKIQHYFMVKNLDRLEIQGIYLNILKEFYSKPIAKINLNAEKL